MSANLASLTQRLCETIIEHYQISAPGGAAQPFLALELGTPIPLSAFDPPPGQAAEVRAILAGEFLARVANREPRTRDGMMYSGGLVTIDGMYGLALEGSMVDPASPDAALFETTKSRARNAF